MHKLVNMSKNNAQKEIEERMTKSFDKKGQKKMNSKQFCKNN